MDNQPEDAQKPEPVVSKPTPKKVHKFLKPLIYVIAAVFLIGLGVSLERFVIDQNNESSYQVSVQPNTSVCELLSEEEVSGIVGAGVVKSSGGQLFSERTSSNSKLLGPCSYNSAEGTDPSQIVTVTYTVRKFNSSQDSTAEFDRQKTAIGENQEVLDLGDAAIWNQAGGQLIVSKGNYVLSVSSGKLQQPNKDSSISAAQLIEGRLSKLD